ncbi:MAG: T9SS type A sorting domain-containing protein [Vicingaceae bacterium]
MRTNITFFIAFTALIFIIQPANAQYKPMLQNLGWCVEQYYGLGSVLTDYTIIGDSSVNGSDYTMLLRFDNQLHLLREDTAERQVFYRDTANSNDYLIYDFSLNTGDSIMLFDSTILFYVDSVALITRKHLYLSTIDTNVAPTLTWIEGIGSTYNPVYNIDRTYAPNATGSAGFCLTCAYADVGIKIYSGNCVIPCQGSFMQPCHSFMVGLEEFERGSEMRVYPNPSTGSFTIELPERSEGVVKVFSQTGQLLHVQSFHATDHIPISSDLPPGFYLIDVLTSQGHYQHKVSIER